MGLLSHPQMCHKSPKNPVRRSAARSAVFWRGGRHRAYDAHRRSWCTPTRRCTHTRVRPPRCLVAFPDDGQSPGDRRHRRWSPVIKGHTQRRRELADADPLAPQGEVGLVRPVGPGGGRCPGADHGPGELGLERDQPGLRWGRGGRHQRRPARRTPPSPVWSEGVTASASWTSSWARRAFPSQSPLRSWVERSGSYRTQTAGTGGSNQVAWSADDDAVAPSQLARAVGLEVQDRQVSRSIA